MSKKNWKYTILLILLFVTNAMLFIDVRFTDSELFEIALLSPEVFWFNFFVNIIVIVVLLHELYKFEE